MNLTRPWIYITSNEQIPYIETWRVAPQYSMVGSFNNGRCRQRSYEVSCTLPPIEGLSSGVSRNMLVCSCLYLINVTPYAKSERMRWPSAGQISTFARLFFPVIPCLLTMVYLLFNAFFGELNPSIVELLQFNLNTFEGKVFRPGK